MLKKENKPDKKSAMSLADISHELKLAKSTISRIIAGKGNFSEETKVRVLDYIEHNDYHPNAIAQRLATSRTGNIGVVMPADAFLSVNTFFQVCLMGICHEAVEHNYDVVVTSATEKDCSYLRRLIGRRSVDGVILMRSLMQDLCIGYLSGESVPFVVIGSAPDSELMQVDIEHAKACGELTETLLKTAEKPVGLILGSTHYIVNLNRRKGFEEAEIKAGADLTGKVISDVFTKENIDAAVDRFISQGAGTIICGDDQICLTALERLKSLKISIGKDIRLASFYDNPALKDRAVTAIEADDMALGAMAVTKLVGKLDRKRLSELIPGYRIHYRASTGNEESRLPE
ncbi:MAG TPA: LacI family DNA-binding transcriptional regulator [Oscillospiraceae bacterium]|nr:LacI family DNA-binding transcriptional regulator [Oscillospiraceae bacterium]HPS34712.1 LacI family DNA-binding transcriptional regulator [Oscillospiraceae bacterium]